MRAVVIEDNPDEQKFIEDSLKKMGIRVRSYAKAKEAMDYIRSNRPDLAIVDYQLDDQKTNGILVAKEIQLSCPSCSIIIVSSYARESQITQMLRMKVDNFIKKPVKVKELEECIGEIVLKQAKTAQVSNRPSKAQIDNNNREILWEGQPLPLSKSQYRIVEYLVEHPNQVSDFESLSYALTFDRENHSSARDLVKQHISIIRKKLRERGFEQAALCITTVSQRGFKWIESQIEQKKGDDQDHDEEDNPDG